MLGEPHSAPCYKSAKGPCCCLQSRPRSSAHAAVALAVDTTIATLSRKWVLPCRLPHVAHFTEGLKLCERASDRQSLDHTGEV